MQVLLHWENSRCDDLSAVIYARNSNCSVTSVGVKMDAQVLDDEDLIEIMELLDSSGYDSRFYIYLFIDSSIQLKTLYRSQL